MATLDASTSENASAPLCPSCLAPLVDVEHDAVAGVDACTKCGYVLPESSSTQLQVLGRVLEDEDREFGRTALLSRRTGYVGDHIGQDKQALYHRKKQSEAYAEIKRKLNKYGMAGSFDRVVALLDMLSKHTNMTWGPRTTLLSTACIYITAREGKKRVPLAELASDSDLSETALARAVHTTKNWLQIRVEEVDPIMFLEMPLVHLSTLFKQADPPTLATGKSNWSKANIEYAKSLDFSRVRSVATDILSMSTDTQQIGGRRPEGMACAAILVAMEGVAHKLMPSANDFQTELAMLTGIKPFTVAERYRELNTVVGQFAKQVPWIEIDTNAHKNTLRPLMVKYIEDIVKFRKSLEYDAKQGQDQAAGVSAASNAVQEDEGEGEGERDDQEAPLFERDPLQDIGAASTLMATRREAAGMANQQSKAARSPASKANASESRSRRREVEASEKGTVKPTKADTGFQRPGPLRRKRTTEHIARDLASKLHAAVRLGFQRQQDDVARDQDKAWNSTRVFPPHSDQAVSIRRQVLAGDTAAVILAGKGSIGKSQEEDNSRLSQLLWAKQVDDITDDELFDDDELDNLIRSDKEISKLLKVPKYVEMIEFEEEAERERERRQAALAADIAAGRPIKPAKPSGWLKRRRNATFRPSEVQKTALRQEAIRQGVEVPALYEPNVDKRRLMAAYEGSSTGAAPKRKKTRVTEQTRINAQKLMRTLEEGDDEDAFDLAMQVEDAESHESGSQSGDIASEGDEDDVAIDG
ncbi:hypothetical protein OIV83_001833 [Microbotryomycetes sp. JL201]|nr:hypothetical protein OIV83_001833 [Microbotryomycetes sp. JL201]